MDVRSQGLNSTEHATMIVTNWELPPYKHVSRVDPIHEHELGENFVSQGAFSLPYHRDMFWGLTVSKHKFVEFCGMVGHVPPTKYPFILRHVLKLKALKHHH